MAQLQKLCPECDEPIHDAPVQISGHRQLFFDCPACGFHGEISELKRKFHLTTITGGGEEIVTQEQFDAFMLAHERANHRFTFPFTSTPSIARATAGWTNTTGHGCLQTETTTPGANKIIEFDLLGYNGSDNPFETRFATPIGTHIMRFRCFVGMYVKTNATVTQFAGIQFGTHDTAPPFSATPGSGVAQLRMVGSNDRIQLLTAVGDSSAAVVTEVNLGTIDPHGVVMELEVDPFARLVRGFIDGVHVATHSAGFPDVGAGSSTGQMWGIFSTSGTNAGGSTQVFFSGGELTLYDYASAGAS